MRVGQGVSVFHAASGHVAPWAPSDESGLVLQLEADTGVTYVAGDELEWLDINQTIDATQTIAADVPGYSASPAYVEGNDTSDYLDLSANPIATDSTAHTTALLLRTIEASGWIYDDTNRDWAAHVPNSGGSLLRFYCGGLENYAQISLAPSTWTRVVARYYGAGAGDKARLRIWKDGAEVTGASITHIGTIPASLAGTAYSAFLTNSKFASSNFRGRLALRVDWRAALDVDIIEAQLDPYLESAAARMGLS